MPTAQSLLESYWGYPAFRPGQAEIIGAAMEGRDVLAVLPTGGGKSLCYQIPALLRGGLTLVVSPLIALMTDQVQALAQRGIEAAALTSALSFRQTEQLWTDAEFGRYRLLYIAPEQLQSERFVARIERLPVTGVAVDEAHCISEWGHDFRPAYREVAALRALLPEVPLTAVTATATPAVRTDIAEQLALRDPFRLVQGFDRPNLVWSLFEPEDKRAKLREILRAVPGSGIVYAGTRRGTEEWAKRLKDEGVSAEAYHAGLHNRARAAVQARWLGGQTRVIVATSAFGMGIDKADVRFVVHVGLPSTLESYYQEAGRGGRDGQRAHAVLLYNPKDERLPSKLLEANHPNGPTVQAVYRAVCELAHVPLGSQPEGPIGASFDALGVVTGLKAGAVRAAAARVEAVGAWSLVQPQRHLGYLRVHQPPEPVRAYAERLGNLDLARFVSLLLRSLPAEAFAQWTPISFKDLAKATGLERPRLEKGLAYLAQHDLVSVQIPSASALHVLLAHPRTERLLVDGKGARARASPSRKAVWSDAGLCARPDVPPPVSAGLLRRAGRGALRRVRRVPGTPPAGHDYASRRGRPARPAPQPGRGAADHTRRCP